MWSIACPYVIFCCLVDGMENVHIIKHSRTGAVKVRLKLIYKEPQLSDMFLAW